jgi:hypothetical protein
VCGRGGCLLTRFLCLFIFDAFCFGSSSSAVEICLTILTDAVAATHALAIVTVMMYGFGRENYLLTQSFLSGCQSFRGPALIVAACLVCKLVLWKFVRFMLLRDYSIDLINVLRYLLLNWGAFLAFQFASASCVVYVLLLRHAGAQDVISGVLQPSGSPDCVYQLRSPPSSARLLRFLHVRQHGSQQQHHRVLSRLCMP